MTGPEANQQYDLWVDRCRQQLERGAAGNALTTWMQSEGVSADTAAAILEAARSGAAAAPSPADNVDPGPDASPQATQADTAAAPVEAAPPETADGTAPSGIDPSADPPASPAPSQQTSSSDSAAVTFKKAFGRPETDADGDPTAAAPDADEPPGAPTAAEPPQAAPPPTEQAAPPQTFADEPSTDALHSARPAAGEPDPEAEPSVPQPAAEPDGPDTESPDPPAPSAALPSNPFGTPRARMTLPAAPPLAAEDPHGEATAPGAGDQHAGSAPPASPVEEPAATTAHAADPNHDLAAPPDSGTEEDSRHLSPPETVAAEPEGEGVTIAEPEVEPGSGVAHEGRTAEPDMSAPDESDIPVGRPDPTPDLEVEETARHEDTGTGGTDRETLEQPAMMTPPSEPLAPESSSDDVETDGEIAGTGAPDEPAQFAESLEEAASRMGMDLRRSAHHGPADSYEDVLRAQQERGLDRSEELAGDDAAEAADEPCVESEHEADSTAQKPAKDRHFGRRSARPAPLDAADAGDEPAPADHGAGGEEPGAAVSEPAGQSDSELARVIREAERGADQEPRPSALPPDPKTEEELAAAAKELGISFRDDPGTGPPSAHGEEDDETARAARELGISFRDEPAGPDSAEPDDATAKAAQELGINFRDTEQPKAEQQSTLRRYWPIILVMALAAIGMPIAATLLLFAGTS